MLAECMVMTTAGQTLGIAAFMMTDLIRDTVVFTEMTDPVPVMAVSTMTGQALVMAVFTATIGLALVVGVCMMMAGL